MPSDTLEHNTPVHRNILIVMSRAVPVPGTSWRQALVWLGRWGSPRPGGRLMHPSVLPELPGLHWEPHVAEAI